jgi:Ca-activated chloride channel family protein
MSVLRKCMPHLSLCILTVLCVSVVCVSVGKFTPETQTPLRSHRGSRPLQRTPENTAASPDKMQDPAKKQSESEAEVVRVETNLVNTLFTAVDKDRHFVTSLRAEDIRIFENDVAQPVSLFERETDRPLSLALLIDTSESQRGVLPAEKQAARAFVDLVIRPNIDQAAVVSFTGIPTVQQTLTNDLIKLRKGIERVKVELSPENERRLAIGEDPLPKDQDPTGYTGIWDAMWFTIEDLLSKAPAGTSKAPERASKAPEPARRAIILLSDGDDTSSTIKKQDVIDLAVKTDVVIYSIGIRDRDFELGKLDSGSLKKISDRTGGRAFFPAQPDDLRLAFSQIDQELRSQYLIAYSPTNSNHDGSYRRIKIEILSPELRKNKVQLLYRQGYYARKNQVP